MERRRAGLLVLYRYVRIGLALRRRRCAAHSRTTGRFDAVLVYTDLAPADGVALGDSLAGFVEQGGGVVLAAEASRRIEASLAGSKPGFYAGSTGALEQVGGSQTLVPLEDNAWLIGLRKAILFCTA